MSGGVDSTAAALLLKQAGHEVAGLHMLLHEGSDATWRAALRVGEDLGIPMHMVDLAAEFRELVIAPFVRAYAEGRTPSPCPLCNRFIKMGLLFEKARALGYDRLATGHYARVEATAAGPILRRGKDTAKDQSYFLFMLTGEMLARAAFPLGELTKDRVRALLKSQGIRPWDSEESQELCFVPQDDYRRFLEREGVVSLPGPIVDTEGRILGRHRGVTHYTVGQRRGLGICGPEPLYVIGIDAKNGTLVVGPRRETYVPGVRIGRINILRETPLQVGEKLEVKVRSTALPVTCLVEAVEKDIVEVRFVGPQSGIAPGQAAVLYLGDRVVAGGWIEPWKRKRPPREIVNEPQRHEDTKP